MSVVRRHPLITFFVLTYALTWWAVPFGGFIPTGPLLAALIVIPITQGLSGLRDLGSRMIRWRVGWYWYVVAIGLPLAVLLVTVALNVALGAGAPSLAQLGPLSSIMVFAVLLTIWHVPLFFLEGGLQPFQPSIVLGGVLGPFAFTFVATWLFNNTGGGVLMTLVMHATEGTIRTRILWAAPAAQAALLYSVVMCAVAIGLVIFDWQLWRGSAPAPATVQPAYGSESRVR